MKTQIQDGIPPMGSSSDGLSNVIHLRSLPDDVSTKEIVDLALPFKKYGKIKNFLPLKVSTVCTWLIILQHSWVSLERLKESHASFSEQKSSPDRGW